MGWCIRAPPRRRSGVRGIQSGALDGFGLSETAARAADRTNCSPELPTPACGCAAASARRRALGSRRAVGAARMSGTARWSDREPRRTLPPPRQVGAPRRGRLSTPHSASGLPTAPGAGSRRHRRPRGDVTLLPGISSRRARSVPPTSIRASNAGPLFVHGACWRRCGRHAPRGPPSVPSLPLPAPLPPTPRPPPASPFRLPPLCPSSPHPPPVPVHLEP